MRKFTSLKDVLPLALGQVAANTTAAGPLKGVWDELVGPAIANNSAPLSLVNGTLVVQAQNRQWAEELARRAPTLLPGLQAKLGERVVRSLIFQVKG